MQRNRPRSARVGIRTLFISVAVFLIELVSKDAHQFSEQCSVCIWTSRAALNLERSVGAEYLSRIDFHRVSP